MAQPQRRHGSGTVQPHRPLRLPGLTVTQLADLAPAAAATRPAGELLQDVSTQLLAALAGRLGYNELLYQDSPNL